MKFKRLAAALLSAAMIVSLVACSGNEEPEQSGSEATESEAIHVNLAESWGFEYFYTIITPEVSSSQYDITYYLTKADIAYRLLIVTLINQSIIEYSSEYTLSRKFGFPLIRDVRLSFTVSV